MSVLCASVPDFLITLALRHTPALVDAPLGLLGADDRIWAASPQAQAWGVGVGQPARTARARCPHLVMRNLDLPAAQAQQDAFLGELMRWELPHEAHGWGAGYIDLHHIATRPADVRPLAVELGRRLRTALGASLAPSLGWDSGKFTARAAAAIAKPNALRLVGKADESRFLSPLPVSLLPLPEAALEQLRWLGIRTLGQFAALPPVAVQQRWGAPGNLAHRWAQGHDNRPVNASFSRCPEPLTVDFDPPTTQIGRALAAIMDALRPTLASLDARLAGIQRLRLNLHFLPVAQHTLDIPFVLPAAQAAHIQSTLVHALQTLIWPGTLESIEIIVQSVGDLVAGQLSLFETDAPDDNPILTVAQRLAGKYGRCFFLGRVTDASHPIAERAILFQPL
jgi:hypothetical protein